MISAEYYAGSVAFDTEDLEREDQVFTAFDIDTLVEKMYGFMKRRKNSEVHFACHKIGKKEIDITEKVRKKCATCQK